MIKIFDNFIPENLTEKILKYARLNSKEYVWSISNITYHPDLVQGSAPIISMNLSQDLHNELIKLYTNNFKQFKNKEFLIDFKIYTPNSFITWHGDANYLAGSTIYLNRDYYENDGGIFLYKDKNNDIKGIEPKFRSMILNYGNKNEHCVTAISPKPRFLRETIQLFVKE